MSGENNEEKCQKCGNLIEFCVCGKERPPTEIIEVKHTGLPTKGEGNLKAQLEAEKKRRESAELIIEAEAMKEILKSRDSLLQRIPESRREAIKSFIGEDDPDPQRMEQVRASLILQGQDFSPEDDEGSEIGETPAGKSVLPDYLLPPNQRGQTRSPTYTNPVIQKFSDLYAILRSPTSTEEQKKEVESVLDDVFVEIGRGLRTRRRGDSYMLPSGCVSHCLKCGKIQEADLGKVPCNSCGFDFSKDKLPRNPKWQPR